MAIFNGSEGAPIERDQAAAWTANYRDKEAEAAAETVINAHFFGKETIQKLLEQPGCMGIRIYYALDDKGQKQLLLVGTDADGNDLEDLIMDFSKPCPPTCVSAGILMG